MTAWLLLAAAILSEVTATLSLKAAVFGSKKWYAVVVAGYGLAFPLIATSLKLGMPLGVAYGVWAAAGVALTAIASAWLFKERLNRIMIVGIGLIIAGVLTIQLGRAD